MGADRAAWRLADLDDWRRAQVVKANPDRAQLPVRAQALRDGKTLYIAVPKLADARPFLRLDPTTLAAPRDAAADIDVARTEATPVFPDEVEPLDVVICGTVAVNRAGIRIGKGAGYSDLEVALLTDAGAITPHTLIVTTVHPIQVLDEPLPAAEHDFTVDVIVTSDEVIRCNGKRRPTTVNLDAIPEDRIAAMPILAALRSDQPRVRRLARDQRGRSPS